MLHTIPWKLPGQSQQLDIEDVIYSRKILEEINRLDKQYPIQDEYHRLKILRVPEDSRRVIQ